MSESGVVVTPEPLPIMDKAHLAAAGFLARYSGRTRDAYALDLRTFFGWCASRGVDVFAMTRPHVELYVRWMEEERGYAPATTARRLSTVIGFYRFAVIDGYLDASAPWRTNPKYLGLSELRVELGVIRVVGEKLPGHNNEA